MTHRHEHLPEYRVWRDFCDANMKKMRDLWANRLFKREGPDADKPKYPMTWQEREGERQKYRVLEEEHHRLTVAYNVAYKAFEKQKMEAAQTKARRAAKRAECAHIVPIAFIVLDD